MVVDPCDSEVVGPRIPIKKNYTPYVLVLLLETSLYKTNKKKSLS